MTKIFHQLPPDAPRFLPTVILVAPTQDGNIGATARAMANFGLRELRLVNPPEGWDTLFCRQMASGANGILDAVKTFTSTTDALADLHYVYATTARRRGMAKPLLSARQAALDAAQRSGTPSAPPHIGFMFGTEKWGLSNDDLAIADALVTINLSPDHASLNLAQAVLLLAYEWYQAIAYPQDEWPHPETTLMKGKSPFATKAEVSQFFDHLVTELDAANFWRIPEKKPEMARNLMNIFLRCTLTSQEVKTLRGLIQALVYYRWPHDGRDKQK